MTRERVLWASTGEVETRCGPAPGPGDLGAIFLRIAADKS
jgi:hypothetical protein